MYRMPRCAEAMRPGSKFFSPDLMACSISSDPTRRSSVAPTGKSTMRTWRADGLPDLPACWHHWHTSLGDARLTAVGAAGHHGNLGQQCGQRAYGSALGSALLATDQHSADAGVDRIEQQRALHRRLADDGSEGEPGLAARRQAGSRCHRKGVGRSAGGPPEPARHPADRRARRAHDSSGSQWWQRRCPSRGGSDRPAVNVRNIMVSSGGSQSGAASRTLGTAKASSRATTA